MNKKTEIKSKSKKKTSTTAATKKKNNKNIKTVVNAKEKNIIKDRMNNLINSIDEISVDVPTNKTDDTIEKDLMVNTQNKKSVEWLESQNEALSDDNEKLKEETKIAKENYNKLLLDVQKSGKTDNIELKNGVKKLYGIFLNDGKIMYSRHKWLDPDVKLKYVLLKFKEILPFLNK